MWLPSAQLQHRMKITGALQPLDCRDMNRLDNAKSAKATDALLGYETVKYFNNEEFERSNYEKVGALTLPSSVATLCGRSAYRTWAVLIWCSTQCHGALHKHHTQRCFSFAQAIVDYQRTEYRLIASLNGLNVLQSLVIW